MAESIILTRTHEAAHRIFGDDALASSIAPKALRARLAPDAAFGEDEQDSDLIRLKGGYVLMKAPGEAADLNRRLEVEVGARAASELAVDSNRRLRSIAPMLTEIGVNGSRELPWNLKAVGIVEDRNQPTGKGAKVAILDSGFDFEHPDFQSRPRNDDREGPGTPPVRPLDGTAGPDPRDENGHGTHAGGIIAGPLRPVGAPRYGIAPDTELLSVNIIDDQLTNWNLLAGMVQAAESGAHVISISVGSPRRELHPTHSPLFELVARILRDWYGTIIVAAAGNESNRRQQYTGPIIHPADCPSIVAVGAVNERLDPALTSSGGICNQRTPTLVAPGVAILSSFLSTNGHAQSPYVVLNGTSSAAPHVAGVAALWIEKGYRGNDLLQVLIHTAKPLGNGSRTPSRDFGFGLVQAPRS